MSQLIALALSLAIVCTVLAIALLWPSRPSAMNKSPLHRAIDQLNAQGTCFVERDTAEQLKAEAARCDLDLIFEHDVTSRFVRVSFGHELSTHKPT